jgi:hypothetical protein
MSIPADANIGDIFELNLTVKHLYDHLCDMAQKEVTGRRAVSDLEYRAKKEKCVQEQLDKQGADSIKPIKLAYSKSNDIYRVCDGYTRITIFLRNEIPTIDTFVRIEEYIRKPLGRVALPTFRLQV